MAPRCFSLNVLPKSHERKIKFRYRNCCGTFYGRNGSTSLVPGRRICYPIWTFASKTMTCIAVLHVLTSSSGWILELLTVDLVRIEGSSISYPVTMETVNMRMWEPEQPAADHRLRLVHAQNLRVRICTYRQWRELNIQALLLYMCRYASFNLFRRVGLILVKEPKMSYRL